MNTATSFAKDEAAYAEWHDSHTPSSLAALLDAPPTIEDTFATGDYVTLVQRK